MTTLGAATVSMENPAIGRHGFAFSTFSWVGWMILIYGIIVIAVSLHDLRINRKKRLADLARCKAERQREQAVPKDEEKYST